jgi:hypothetical protein
MSYIISTVAVRKLVRIIGIVAFLFFYEGYICSQGNIIKKDNLLSFRNYENIEIVVPKSLESIIYQGRKVMFNEINFNQDEKHRIPGIRLSDSIVDYLSTQFELPNIIIRDHDGVLQPLLHDTLYNSNSSMVSWCKERKIKIEAYYCGKLLKNQNYQSNLFLIVLTNKNEPIFSRKFFFIFNTNIIKIVSYIEIAYRNGSDGAITECVPKKLNDCSFYCEEVFSLISDVVLAGTKSVPKNNTNSTEIINYYMIFRFDELGYIRIASD